MQNDNDPEDQTGSKRHVPLLAHIAGVKDERTFYSDEVGPSGRKSLVARGWHKLVVPALLAGAVSVIGFFVMGAAGLCFGPLFFVANAWIQSIVNPIISERRVMHLSTGVPALTAFVLLLVSGTFAATLTAWFLFKSTVDQRHYDGVATVMSASQEKQDLTFSENALEKERANLLASKQVSTSGIDQAAKAFAQAQETAASANAAYQAEITTGRGGRRPGDGPAAKALWQALQDAKAAEARAKLALDEARTQASVTISVPENLVAAYNAAKGKYEAKEKSLLEAGPGLLKTFWWLAGMLHTEPMLIVFLLVWTTLEASGVISHSFAGRNVYERARLATIKDDAEVQREARRIIRERRTADAEHKADMITARKDAKVVVLEAKDRAKR